MDSTIVLLWRKVINGKITRILRDLERREALTSARESAVWVAIEFLTQGSFLKKKTTPTYPVQAKYHKAVLARAKAAFTSRIQAARVKCVAERTRADAPPEAAPAPRATEHASPRRKTDAHVLYVRIRRKYCLPGIIRRW